MTIVSIDWSQRPVHRVAISYVPGEGDPWRDAGMRWLGRSNQSRERIAQPMIADIPAAEQRRLTAAPRRFGWQASLFPPFVPQPGIGLDEINSHLDAICSDGPAIKLPRLKLALLDNCLALVPEQGCPPVNELAATLVSAFSRLARRPGEDETARWRSAGLTPQQEELLLRWGSPHVMEQYRFAFFLSGSLGGLHPVSIKRLIAAAQMHFSGLSAMTLNRVSLFIEPEPSSDFILAAAVNMGAHAVPADA